MQKYVGVKLVEAEPMDQKVFIETVRGDKYGSQISELGYKVVYPGGYVSWSPKDVFEKAYMKVGDNNKIEERNVHDFVKGIEYQQWGDKTTIAKATLTNGFVIVESSSCVDPANFSMDIGSEICKEAIYNRVWNLLGFLLQSGQYGIKGN